MASTTTLPSAARTRLILRAGGVDAAALEERVRQALERRQRDSVEYPTEEIDHITALDRRLFTGGFELDEELTTRFRALSALSRCELRPIHQIKSHRPLLGPLIVRLKRLVFPLVAVHFKESFKSLQEFNSWSVANQAALAVELYSRPGSTRGAVIQRAPIGPL